jgi:methionyl-tRNA formyltransferase
MRIVVFGQAAFGEKVIEVLVKKGEEVVGVFTTPDTPDKANPPKELAVRLGIPAFQPERMRAPQVHNDYVKLKAELNVMAYVTSILPETILNYPKFKTIQYHPSLLPKHRGGSAINWAIIQGETKTGITIFWPDQGIDTGPILLQKEVDISADDTVGSLYFNKLFPLGVEAIVESIDLIERGNAPRIPQDESQASYEELCTERDAVIDWLKPATQVHNMIRGTNPQPGAITHFGDRHFKIFDAELLACIVESPPGQVTGVTEHGFTVAASDGTILVRRVQASGSPKVAANEFAQQVQLEAGSRLGD